MAEVQNNINPVLAHILAQKPTPDQQVTLEAVQGFVDDQYVDAIVKFQEAHAEGIQKTWKPDADPNAIATFNKVWAVAGERLARKNKK